MFVFAILHPPTTCHIESTFHHLINPLEENIQILPYFFFFLVEFTLSHRTGLLIPFHGDFNNYLDILMWPDVGI